MSRRSAEQEFARAGFAGRGLADLGFVALAAFLAVATGCWEQNSPEWFPQMKRQPAFQAYELVTYDDRGQGFVPPEGTVPIDSGSGPSEEDLQQAIMKPTEGLFDNPVPVSLTSLKRGEELYLRQCSVCHGENGMGNGPVAGPPFGNGPFGLVLPVNGPISQIKNYSDSYIYTIITNGRGRMPSYRRVLPEERWDIVHFLRALNDQGASQ